MLLFLVVVEEVTAGNHEGSEDSDSDSEEKKEGRNINILVCLGCKIKRFVLYDNNCNVDPTFKRTP